jgi:serralysin
MGLGGNDQIDGGGGEDVIDAGDGDDVVTISESQNGSFMRLIGGSGIDTLVVKSSLFYFPTEVRDFEVLKLSKGGQFNELSGFSSISLANGAMTELSYSRNPTASIDLVGSIFVLGMQSTIGSIVGSDANEVFRIAREAQVLGNVDLGGGTDRFGTAAATLAVGNGSPFGGIVSGGSGFDEIALGTLDGTPDIIEHYRSDLSKLLNFESLSLETIFLSITKRYVADVTLLSANGLNNISLGAYGRFGFENSNSPNAALVMQEGSELTIGVGTSLMSVFTIAAGSEFNGYDTDTRGVTVFNHGEVRSSIQLSAFDDVYYGADGVVGGTVSGHGGNDRLYGGSAAERLEGGTGQDYLSGGGGGDVLLGGFGSDIMLGGTGNDIYEVDNGGDIVFEGAGSGNADKVFAYVDFALPDHVEHLIMQYGNQRFGTGNAGDNIIIGNGQSNVIEGGTGYDTLTGDADSDFFIIRPGFGVDVITDFIAGAGSPDAVLFSSTLFTSFGQVMANSAQVGADTWIGDGFGNTIVLVGVQQSSLHADDFGFF